MVSGPHNKFEIGVEVSSAGAARVCPPFLLTVVTLIVLGPKAKLLGRHAALLHSVSTHSRLYLSRCGYRHRLSLGIARRHLATLPNLAA